MCDSGFSGCDALGALVSNTSPSTQRAERLRVQELLRYFQVPKPIIGSDKPRVALDTSLSAYAQLSALRLDCQRSFISLVDHETQYIIAEATRTVSLETGDTDAGPDDAIYLGATNLDIFWGVCPNTISVFTSTDSSVNIAAPYVKANQSYYVMNDLSKVPGYETRPYIIGWPYMRYYAEVPIRSPSGLVIGSLCVVDNKPREGLDMKGISILEEISHAVMDHLDLVMSKVQRKRAERMIQGLGLFLEGSDSLREWWIESQKSSRLLDPNQRRLTVAEQADKEFGAQGSSNLNAPSSAKIELGIGGKTGDTDLPNFDISKRLLIPESSTDSNEMLSPSPEQESNPWELPELLNLPEDRRPEANTKGIAEGGFRNSNFATNSSKARSASINSSGQTQLTPRTDIKPMLARAANLIREAVSLSGVTFFDPPVSISRIYDDTNSQGQVGVRNASTVSMTSDGTQWQDETVSNSLSPNDVTVGHTDPKMCKILAISMKTMSDKAETSKFSLELPERMLRRIVRKFPQGGILEYDRKGLVSYGPLELAWYQNIPMAQKISSPNKVLHTYSAEPDENNDMEAEFLRHLLPDVRSIILFPLWDLNRDRLFAYNMAWTTDGNRVFQREDYAYLASFCNSITSELSRLDTVAADQAKANFISSISHELRSPLHGVLASTEILRTLTRDPTSIEIINTIETCGSTLLDTMESLLSFAKINEVTVTQQQKNSLAKLPPLEQIDPQTLQGSITEVDLALLVEEVMNANISGHQFRKSLEKRSSHSIGSTSTKDHFGDAEETVTVVCDIDVEENWVFATQPGTWKRIVINLFGNSLKYSDIGFIHVKLSQEEIASSGSAHKVLVCLAVEDSGKGISDDYMKYHLFTPFQQENPLCPGTGLGLSIVQQLVASINGTIKVESEIGHGTRIEVKVALDSIPGQRNHDTAQNLYSEMISHSKIHKVGLVALDTYPDIQKVSTEVLAKKLKTDFIVKSSLTRAIEKGYSLRTINLPKLDSNSEDVDCLIMTESYFRANHAASGLLRTLPLIILCSKVALDYRADAHLNGPVFYLSQPFGPRKLAHALESCIQYIGREPALNSYFPSLLPNYAGTESDLGEVSHGLTESLQISNPVLESSLNGSIHEKVHHRLLLVEDDPINLKLLVTFLDKLGYLYATAKDGLQALEAYKSANGKFDIIFMDIQMPRMNGMVASYEIRQFEERNSLDRTPIIALTGLATVDAEEEATLSGIDLFLAKPVPMKKLKAVLEVKLYPRSLIYEDETAIWLLDSLIDKSKTSRHFVSRHLRLPRRHIIRRSKSGQVGASPGIKLHKDYDAARNGTAAAPPPEVGISRGM